MKSYVKPTIEVISMRTSENIADNIIKTIYTKSDTSDGIYTLNENGGYYSESDDITGSQTISKLG